MKALIKKCAALVLAAATALSLAAGIQAATTIYSVKIQKNSILVQNKGKTVQTYNAKSTDLTLSREDGELLLGYKNAQNLSRDIALGTQSTLTVEGTVSSLSLDSSLPTSMRLVLDTGSSVSSLKIAAPGKITIRGKVDTLTVSSAARITVSKGGAVTDATLTSGSAVLTAGTGAQVKNATVVKKSSVSGSGIGTVKVRGSDSDDGNDDDTTTDDGLTVKTSTISARSGDTLRDLESDLNHYVKVYDEDGDRIDGKAEWVSSYSTRVKKTGTFKFDFYPDDDDYDTVRGTIKISVSGGEDDDSTNDDGLTVKTSTISARSGDTLRDLESDLNHYVKVYDEDGDRIDGKAEWVSSYSTKVKKTGTFKFDFYPDDDDYDDVRGSIRIEVSGSSSSSGKKVRLYVSPITLSSTSERLRDLEDELEDSVKAYYDGNSVRGDVSWEDSGSTQVKKTGTYTFVFEPDSSSYNAVTGEIKIIIDTDSDDDDDGEYGNDDYTLEIEDIHTSSSTKRLGSLLGELEDAVVVRDDDGDKIDGEPYWVDSSNTRVRETGTYRFTFTPKSSRYDPVTAKIKIYVD